MRTASTTVLMLDVIVTKTLLCLYIHPLKITKISFSSGYNYFGWSNCINMKITSSCGKSFGNYHCSQQNQPERFSLLHQLSCLMDYHAHRVFNGLCSPMLVNPHFFFQEPCLLILLFLSLHYCQPIFICSQTLQYVRFFFFVSFFVEPQYCKKGSFVFQFKLLSVLLQWLWPGPLYPSTWHRTDAWPQYFDLN